jgi:phosphatidate cytidylyltransferase
MTGIVSLLTVATFTVVLIRKLQPHKNHLELIQRIQTWWIIVGTVFGVLMISETVSLVFFAFVSFLALKEFLSLIPTRRADRRIIFWAYISIPIQYWWIHINWYGMFIIFIPVYVFLFLPTRMVLKGETAGFLKAAGTLHWGLMTTVFSLSHLAFLLVLPRKELPLGFGSGLVIYLLGLTELNDVAQYIWGKTLGKHKVVPTVRPN